MINRFADRGGVLKVDIYIEGAWKFLNNFLNFDLNIFALFLWDLWDDSLSKEAIARSFHTGSGLVDFNFDFSSFSCVLYLFRDSLTVDEFVFGLRFCFAIINNLCDDSRLRTLSLLDYSDLLFLRLFR